MKKILVLITVATVLFSSGCLEGIIGSKSTVTSYGVVVNEFGPDFSELESGDKFDLYLEIENTGGAKATDVWAHLYDFDRKSEEFGELDPPDEEAGIPGEVKDVTWEEIAPDNPEGVVYTYTPRVRLMYDYKTIATANLPLLTKTEYKRLKERNQLNIPPITTEVSKGPVAVEISARAPIVIEDFDEDTVDFRINIDLLGRGTVFNSSHSNSDFNLNDDELDKVTLKITALGIEGAATDENGNSLCDAYDTEKEIDMRKGKTYTYSCELNASNFAATKTIPVTVELDYGYFEDYSTTITVRGK